MTKEFDDKLDRAARQLATEISPESDLWPGIASAIATPKRSRWTPMLAQAAAIVLLVGTSSAVTYVVTKDSSGPVVSVAPELVFEQAAFGGNYHLGPGFQDARNSLRDDLDIELARLSDEAREVPVDDAARERIKFISDRINSGHDPRYVGDLVCDGILNNHAYIFTDREHEPTIRARFEGILAAYERV